MSFMTEKKGSIISKKLSSWKQDYYVGYVYIKKMRNPKIDPWWPTVKACKTDYNWIFLRIYLFILFRFYVDLFNTPIKKIRPSNCQDISIKYVLVTVLASAKYIILDWNTTQLIRQYKCSTKCRQLAIIFLSLWKCFRECLPIIKSPKKILPFLNLPD